MLRYRPVLYMDVWDNNGSWAVNQTKTSDKIVYVQETTTPSELLHQLKEFEYIESCDKRKINVTELGRDIIEIREKKSRKPLCRLERIRI